jgi:hypothetical protein
MAHAILLYPWLRGVSQHAITLTKFSEKSKEKAKEFANFRFLISQEPKLEWLSIQGTDQGMVRLATSEAVNIRIENARSQNQSRFTPEARPPRTNA